MKRVEEVKKNKWLVDAHDFSRWVARLGLLRREDKIKSKIIFSILVLIIVVIISLGCIESPPLEPSAEISATPTTVRIGENVSFSAIASTDPDGNITSYEWYFDDGNASSGVTVSHAYSNWGTYTTELTVIDNDGLQNTAEVNVTVILDTVKLKVSSHTWREGEEHYDVYSAIKNKLEKAGFKVVPEESSNYNAVLCVGYGERKGDKYIPGGYGTRIGCDIKLYDKMNNLLFETIFINAHTSPTGRGSLYWDAVSNFKDNPKFKYLGEIIAIRYGIGDGISLLASALKAEDGEVRREAAVVLGQIGDERAVEPLIVALTGEDPWLRKEAAVALGKIGDERAVEPLIVALTGDDQSWVREAAAEALGNIGDERAVEPLKAVFRNGDWVVQASAVIALKKINQSNK